MEPMTPDDLRSPQWRRFTQTLQTRLQELREFNDASANTELKTSLIRGQISEVKRILALSPESARDEGIPRNGDAATPGNWQTLTTEL